MDMAKKIGAGICVLSLTLTLCCAGYLYQCHQDKRKALKATETLKELYISREYLEQEEQKNYELFSQALKKEASSKKLPSKTGQKQKSKANNLSIDWPGIDSENLSILAWIDIPGTSISYPIVQSDDNEYYLHHTVEQEYSDYGSIFLNCTNQSDFSDSHSILYGHNMNDGTMFADLNCYQDASFYKTAPYIYIYIPGEVLTYQIFSVFQSSLEGPSFRYDLPLKSREYARQLQEIKEDSLYDMDVAVTSDQPFITLFTCNNQLDYSMRTSVHGIRIDRTSIMVCEQ